MLKINNIHASYGDLKVLYDVSLHVDQGEIVSLVGSNGAGKSTLLRIISGFLPITAGSISFEDKNLLLEKTSARANLGIAHIPQGRGILGKLSVRENLELGAYEKRMRANIQTNLEKVYKIFPILKTRSNQKAGSFSGGEQQMLAIARALMMGPKLIMMDEPSLGLAPIVVEEVFRVISEISGQGISILLVEQNLVKALSVASRGYVLENGRIVNEGKSGDLLQDPAVRSAYLGI